MINNNFENENDLSWMNPTLLSKLIKHLETKEILIEVIKEKKASVLASIPGIGIKTAINIIQDDMKNRKDVNIDSVLKTQDTKQMYNEIFKIIRSYLSSEYAKEKLSLFFPFPSTQIEEIKSRYESFNEIKNALKELNDKDIEKTTSLLKKIKLLKPTSSNVKVKGRIILTTNTEVTEKLKKNRINKFVQIQQLKIGENAIDWIKGYDLVLFFASSEPYDS
ncbi:MAG: hypothetical protein ACTSUV_05555, partial [Candidatus Ranarchaeia archaeon]